MKIINCMSVRIILIVMDFQLKRAHSKLEDMMDQPYHVISVGLKCNLKLVGLENILAV